jgi:sRNA-binding protein
LIFLASGAVPWPPLARNHHQQEECMVKPNYGFAKRQRELEKKRKKEEKAQRKDTRPEDAQPATEAQAPEQPAPAPQGD